MVKLLEYQIEDIRRAVRQYVDENSFVDDDLSVDPSQENILAWITNEHERQALLDLVERIVEIVQPTHVGD